MGEILQNMLRRKVRTFLTVFGIVIGVFALTVMGSMSEYFNTLLDNAMAEAGNTLGVQPSGGFSTVLSEGIRRRIERVPGVKMAIPAVYDSLGELGTVQMGSMDMVLGVPPERIDYLFPRSRLVAGRWIERGDDYHAVIGSKLASKRKLKLGGKLEWNEQEFTVVGILAETQGSMDQVAVVPLDTARRVLKRPDWVASIDVVPERTDPASVNALVKRLNESVPGIKVRTPQEIIDEVRAGLVVFNVIMLSGSVLAVIVGGLAVINTMIMSVSERTREIGIKKAVGASDWDIVLEYVAEAAVIGLLGGVVGLALGTGMASILNTTAAQALGGAEIFTVTPRLAITAVVFAVILGTIAGLYPAWNAARLDPVKALRTE